MLSSTIRNIIKRNWSRVYTRKSSNSISSYSTPKLGTVASSAEPLPKNNRLLYAVNALNSYSLDGIMDQWSSSNDGNECVYDNSMVGPPAKGHSDIRGIIIDLIDMLKVDGTQLQIKHVTEAIDQNGKNISIVEWTPIPDDGREGLHFGKFDDEGYIQHVRVYVRNRKEVPE